jgi:hypothetical protein
MSPIISRAGFSLGFGRRRGGPAPVYAVSPSTASVNEGSSVTFTVTTANVPDGTTLYWSLNTVSGTINTSDFTGAAVTGSFTITSNAGSVVLTLANDVTTEGSESFQLQVRTGSTSGTIVATSSTVTIGDTSLNLPVYTGYALNKTNNTRGAANGSSISASTSGSEGNVGGTATFTTGVPFTTLRVIYGNMSNFSLGNPAGGAVLYINWSAVGATGTYGTDGYSSSYTKYYDTSSSTLNSIGISAGVGGSHEAYIWAIIINGTKLNATGPTYA